MKPVLVGLLPVALAFALWFVYLTITPQPMVLFDDRVVTFAGGFRTGPARRRTYAWSQIRSISTTRVRNFSLNSVCGVAIAPARLDRGIARRSGAGFDVETRDGRTFLVSSPGPDEALERFRRDLVEAWRIHRNPARDEE